MYLATPSGPAVREAMRAGRLGQMVTPEAGNVLEEGVTWALDNGCFSARWDQGRWWARLERYADAPHCLFAVVPDVVGDSVATDALWERWASEVRGLGYRVAYVTQNGCQRVPEDADVVFTGGDDLWKEGAPARRLAAAARERGVWIHMGRVNTRRRLRLAAMEGYDSVDGTTLAWGPDVNLPKLLGWLEPARPTLWGVA